MKSPVARHMNTYNKVFVVRHKHVEKKMDVALQEMKEDALQELVEGIECECDDGCMNDVGTSSISISDEEG